MKNHTLPVDGRGVNRRRFLKTSATVAGAAGLAGLTPANAAGAVVWEPAGRVTLAKNSVILFQGDSVTDASRNRDRATMPNDQLAMGNGYPSLAAAQLLLDRPNDGLKIFNRGVSGNKVFEMAARWQADCLDIKPDVLSILIGVNDYWHTLRPTNPYTGTVEIYERDYLALVERTLKALPKVKLIICEPFVLKNPARASWVVKDSWFPEFGRYQAAAARVAKHFRAAFVPFQAMFDEALKYGPPAFWPDDGVHPRVNGGGGPALMAHEWLKAVRD